jgi:hypothetical protein
MRNKPSLIVIFLILKVLIFWIAHSIGDSGGKKLFLKVDFTFPLIRHPMTYAPTNKSAIDLRIWEGCRFENTHKLGRDLR